VETAWWCGASQPREIDKVATALRLSDEEKELVERAGIGTGLLVSGQRRVAIKVGLPRFDGQVDYAASRRGAWWSCCSYSTGVR
jgi:hypothetical protein